MNANTLFLRLEGPLQAWGDQESKFVIRRTAEAPTKSGVIGMLCAAMGVSRSEAAEKWLPELGALRMGVRIDTRGIRWWDYHTVGAGMRMRIAEGGTKPGAMLTRREYLCDASFLVALQGEPELIGRLEAQMQAPKWTLYLGRKCCPPSRPILEHPPGSCDDLLSALSSIHWRKRLKQDSTPQTVDCLLDWVPETNDAVAPAEALVWYDVPISFEPPAHHPRFVVREVLRVDQSGGLKIEKEPAQRYTPRPLRQRADYNNTEYKKQRAARLEADHHLCVFCKSPATTVQHITYRRAGGNESQDDLRSLCRLCHDAVTMIEYGLGMDIDRINPEDPRWRDLIVTKRDEIIRFRSLETRRRHLAAEEVE
jgi:CRISPR system Cascade subunit CasD